MESEIEYVAFIKTIYGVSKMIFTTYKDAVLFAKQMLNDRNVLLSKVFEKTETYEEVAEFKKE